jgi:hypothetical protein
MEPDLLDCYARASEWTLSKLPAAAQKMDARTPCDEWDVRTLMNHMLDTEGYFVGSARGEDVSPPSPNPPELLGDDPVADFTRGRDETMATFSHRASWRRPGRRSASRSPTSCCTAGTWRRRQGRTPPCPRAGRGGLRAHPRSVHRRARTGVFKPEVTVAEDASAQDKLLAYTGRNPAG